MKTSFIEEGANELTLRFAGSYIGLKSKNYVAPLYIRQVQEVDAKKNTLTILGTILAPRTGDWIPYADTVTESSLDYFPPRPSMLNIKKGAVYYDIVPLRHRIRGLTRDQIRIAGLGFNGKEELTIENVDLCKNIFNPSFIGVGEAVYNVATKKKISAAFCSKFAIVRNKEFNNLTIVHKKRTVGLLSTGDGIVYIPKVSAFIKEELSIYMPCTLHEGIKK
jgi:hypothetical protein